MRSTKYNKKITIQKRTKVPSDTGGWSNTYSTFYTSWASVIATRGIRRLEYGRLGFTESYEVEMRSRTVNVDDGCQIVYDGRTFQIGSIQIDGVVRLDIMR